MVLKLLALIFTLHASSHALLIDPSVDAASKPVVPPHGSCLVFDGVDDVATVPSSDALRYPGRGGWTLELWVRPDAYPQQGETVVFGQESVGVAAHNPYSLRILPGWFEFRVDGPNDGRGIVRFELPLGEWSHVACVYENGRAGRSMSVFVNGERVDRLKVSVRMESRTDPIFMGRLGQHSFEGGIDEARVWSSALDDPDVARSMHADIDPSDHRLRGWWSFDEPRGGIFLDLSPNLSHGLLGNPLDPQDTTAPARVTRMVREGCGF